MHRVNRVNRVNRKKNKQRPIQVSSIQEAASSVNDGDISLDLPNLATIDIPFVSVITVTKNRRNMFYIAIKNWMRTIYLENRIEWVILDDGEEDLSNLFPQDDLRRIRYIRCEKMGIGEKRNKAVELAKHEYIVHMDDDDYYFSTSVLARIRVMLHYNKQCVYSHNLGVYNILSGSSNVMENYTHVPELSMAYTKTFWRSRKFGDAPYESYNMVRKREKDMIKIPFLFNCIACTHNSNYSNRFKPTLQETKKIKEKEENLEDLFDPDFKVIIEGIKNIIKNKVV